MGSEQQFCLRWNNHQSTLISVFDTLLESETLVDVTLAAEGQYLKAHKVVLSACSQYFQELLCHHIEKHPIIILKDVTFQELKALIDYMYRGEVNVSQEQLSALIKTAESLKIKGLADGGDRRPDRKSVPQLSPPLPPVLAPALSGNLSLDGRSMGASEYATNSPLQHAAREGSISPVSRKRKRIRRRSGEGGGGGSHEPDVVGSEQASSSASTISVPNIPATITPVNSGSRTTPGEGDEEEGASGSKGQEGGAEESAAAPSKQSKSEPGTSLQSHSQTPLLEPKSEYREEDEDDGEADEDSMDNVVALEEDVMDMEASRDDGLDQKPGPSHGAEVSGQGSGFAPWHMMPERSGDDIFIPSQESAAQRESQEPLWTQPSSTSPMPWKISSVQSTNMSSWLEDADTRVTASSSSLDRHTDSAIASDPKKLPTEECLSVCRALIPESSPDLTSSVNSIVEDTERPQTYSNSLRFYVSGDRSKPPSSSCSSCVSITSDLYPEQIGLKSRRGRPTAFLRTFPYDLGSSTMKYKENTAVIPPPIKKFARANQRKRPVGRPRKAIQKIPSDATSGHTLTAQTLYPEETEEEHKDVPSSANISNTEKENKRSVRRPLKQTIRSPPESGSPNTSVPKEKKLNSKMVLRRYSLSLKRSVRINKGKRPIGRLCEEVQELPTAPGKTLAPRPSRLKLEKGPWIKGAFVPSSVKQSISAKVKMQPVRRPRNKINRSSLASGPPNTSEPKRRRLNSKVVQGKAHLSVNKSIGTSTSGRHVRTSLLRTFESPSAAGHTSDPRTPKLKEEQGPALAPSSVKQSVSAKENKRPVGRPRKRINLSSHASAPPNTSDPQKRKLNSKVVLGKAHLSVNKSIGTSTRGRLVRTSRLRTFESPSAAGHTSDPPNPGHRN